MTETALDPSSVGSILIVDDEETIREILRRYLSRAGYRCTTAEDGPRALEELQRQEYTLMLTDIMMPELDGIQLLERAKKQHPDIVVIIITGLRDVDMAISAMQKGAIDYITKPFSFDAVSVSVSRALEHRRLVLENRDYQRNLEEKVIARTREIQNLVVSTVKSLAMSLEARDQYTSGHSQRVAEYGVRIARQLELPEEVQRQVHLAGLLHDIGKIGVPEQILHKPGGLTAEEYERIKQHPLIAVRILEPITQLRHIVPAIRSHHERYDGTGYPDGLRDDSICQGGRILAVADTFDAMTSDRPYRLAYSAQATLEKMVRASGRQFDPRIVEAFVSLHPRRLCLNPPATAS